MVCLQQSSARATSVHFFSTMEYQGLTQEKVAELKEDGLSEEQIGKINARELTRTNDKLNKFTTRIHDPLETWQGKELRLVLLGKTGAGKSTFGNLVIGSQVFEESHKFVSCTVTIKEQTAIIDGILVRVIDTPGFHDTHKPPEEILTEIAKVLDDFNEGIHGFLYVFNAATFRFTDDQAETFRQLKQGLFGSSFLKCCFVILSHGEEVAKHGSLLDYLERESTNPFGQLLNDILDRRVIAVESGTGITDFFREEQRKQVIRLIASSNCTVYTNDDVQQHREQTLSKIDASVSALVPSMEKELSKSLQDMPHSKIKGLSDKERKAIIRSVYEKIRSQVVEDVPKEKLHQEIEKVFRAKQNRLTDSSFLDKLKGFAGPLLGAAGIALVVLFSVAAATR